LNTPGASGYLVGTMRSIFSRFSAFSAGSAMDLGTANTLLYVQNEGIV
jgi:actin-like ATPase involved in cell morphogenesis